MVRSIRWMQGALGMAIWLAVAPAAADDGGGDERRGWHFSVAPYL